MADARPDEQSPAPNLNFAVPDLYVDGGQVEVSPFTVSVTLSVGRRPAGVVRMSPAYAKMFAILLKQYLKQAEGRWGEPIAVPEVVLKDRKISLDDW